jgi:hypothetical protein
MSRKNVQNREISEAYLTPKVGEKSPFLGEDAAAALW